MLQEKITKEMNYILSNQDTVLSQITQLESSITQTEVISTLTLQNVAKHVISVTPVSLTPWNCTEPAYLKMYVYNTIHLSFNHT